MARYMGIQFVIGCDRRFNIQSSFSTRDERSCDSIQATKSFKTIYKDKSAIVISLSCTREGRTKWKWLTKMFSHRFCYKNLKLFGFFLLSFKGEKGEDKKNCWRTFAFHSGNLTFFAETISDLWVRKTWKTFTRGEKLWKILFATPLWGACKLKEAGDGRGQKKFGTLRAIHERTIYSQGEYLVDSIS